MEEEKLKKARLMMMPNRDKFFGSQKLSPIWDGLEEVLSNLDKVRPSIANDQISGNEGPLEDFLRYTKYMQKSLVHYAKKFDKLHGEMEKTYFNDEERQQRHNEETILQKEIDNMFGDEILREKLEGEFGDEDEYDEIEQYR
jgi:hypothetical protein